MNQPFDVNCRHCPRLATFLDEVKAEYKDYYARPVPAFGDPEPQLFIVGLAPGMHGANATGRPFTGDYAGILLYETLYKYGYASAPVSTGADDGLRLTGCRISNAVKCLPPQNKPTSSEIRTCNEYLTEELLSLKPGAVIMALGTIAHQSVLRALDYKLSSFKFAHAAVHKLENELILVDSYHCSRYNTQTRRLTEEMFCNVFELIRQQLLL